MRTIPEAIRQVEAAEAATIEARIQGAPFSEAVAAYLLTAIESLHHARRALEFEADMQTRRNHARAA